MTWRRLAEESHEGLRCEFCNELILTLLDIIHDAFSNNRQDKYRNNYMTPNSDRRKYIKGEWETIKRELIKIFNIKIDNRKL